MKFFIIVALVSAASAAPSTIYTNYPYYSTAYTGYATPTAYVVIAKLLPAGVGL